MTTGSDAEINSETALLEAIFPDWERAQVRQRYPAIGMPLLGVWAEIGNPDGIVTVRRVLACANLPGAHELLSGHGCGMVEEGDASSWSIREFRTQPPDRHHPRAWRHWQTAEERVIEIGY